METKDFTDLPNSELEHSKDFNLIAIYQMIINIEKTSNKIKVFYKNNN